MDLLPLIIQLIGGALGGVGAGKAMPSSSLGSMGNIISGLVGGAGGGILTVVIGLIKNAMAK